MDTNLTHSSFYYVSSRIMPFCTCFAPPPPRFTIDCPHVRLLVTVHHPLSRHQLTPMLYLRNQPDPLKSLRSLFGHFATVEQTDACAVIHIDDGFLDVAELRMAGII